MNKFMTVKEALPERDRLRAVFGLEPAPANANLKQLNAEIRGLEVMIEQRDKATRTGTATAKAKAVEKPTAATPVFTRAESQRIFRTVFREDPSDTSDSALSQDAEARILAANLKCPQTAGMELPATKLTGMQQAKRAVLQDRLNQALGLHPQNPLQKLK
jgi:hypothetical protein